MMIVVLDFFLNCPC